MKAAAPVQSSDSADGSTEGSTDGSTDGTQSAGTDSASSGDGSSDGTITNSGGFTRNSLPIPTRPELFTATPMAIPL